ncbi:Hypersensitive-induced response protein 4 [Acorus gramineus]|uniref:Hypersensitive-induced response protein 4 n=1 Tax=Acorus gramineus TaxID=55184 RepID=A0AAV9AAM4_ACOGR|nr:Hypersensitive-induced response protein 4 [Acorus gramineus]
MDGSNASPAKSHVVRALVPRMTLDDLFEQKGDVAKAILEELEKDYNGYSFLTGFACKDEWSQGLMLQIQSAHQPPPPSQPSQHVPPTQPFTDDDNTPRSFVRSFGNLFEWFLLFLFSRVVQSVFIRLYVDDFRQEGDYLFFLTI